MNRTTSLMVAAVAIAAILIIPVKVAGTLPSSEVLCGVVKTDAIDLVYAPADYRVDRQSATAVTLDVLFLYSADRAQFDAPSRIDGYMREANEVFRNSRTGIALRLAGAEQMPSGFEGLVRTIEEGTTSNEQTFSRMNNVLEILRRGIGTSDIQRVRSRTRADLVVIWTGMIRHVGGIRALGTALQPGSRFAFSAERGFSILAGNLTQTGLVAHEIGHNLGLAHPRSARGSSDDPYLPHGQGYAAGGYGTVMAYNTPAARFPINVFSMNGFHSGRRVGDRDHRAAEAASAGAQFVADYERSRTPPPDPDPDPDPEPTDPFVLALHNRFEAKVEVLVPEGGNLRWSRFVGQFPLRVKVYSIG